MTSHQALQAMIEFDSSRTYFATKQAACHLYGSGFRSDFLDCYTISMVPGMNGKDCAQFDGTSFEEATAKALHAMRPPVVTEPQPNNE